MRESERERGKGDRKYLVWLKEGMGGGEINRKTDKHARTHTRTHAHTHTIAGARTHAHTRTHARTHTLTLSHTHTNTRTHAHTHARTHRHARTHPPHAHLTCPITIASVTTSAA